jgi:hypothetical protein
MKRLCKDVDITNIDLIQKSVCKCLKGKGKDRYDIKRIFEQYGNCLLYTSPSPRD